MTVDGDDPRGDDLTVLPGIGPVIAGRLRAAGVRRFENLAALDPMGIAELLAGTRSVTERTVRRADWVGRARRLARAGDEDEAEAGYESFVVRIHTRPAGVVRTVRLQRVTSGEVRHLPDLAAAFREIGALIAAITPRSTTGRSTTGRSSPTPSGPR